SAVLGRSGWLGCNAMRGVAVDLTELSRGLSPDEWKLKLASLTREEQLRLSEQARKSIDPNKPVRNAVLLGVTDEVKAGFSCVAEKVTRACLQVVKQQGVRVDERLAALESRTAQLEAEQLKSMRFVGKFEHGTT